MLLDVPMANRYRINNNAHNIDIITTLLANVDTWLRRGVE